MVGCSKPAISRSRVVLPQPDGPSSVKNSPSWMPTDTASSAFTTWSPPPKCLETARASTITRSATRSAAPRPPSVGAPARPIASCMRDPFDRPRTG